MQTYTTVACVEFEYKDNDRSNACRNGRGFPPLLQHVPLVSFLPPLFSINLPLLCERKRSAWPITASYALHVVPLHGHVSLAVFEDVCIHSMLNPRSPLLVQQRPTQCRAASTFLGAEQWNALGITASCKCAVSLRDWHFLCMFASVGLHVHLQLCASLLLLSLSLFWSLYISLTISLSLRRFLSSGIVSSSSSASLSVPLPLASIPSSPSVPGRSLARRARPHRA